MISFALIFCTFLASAHSIRSVCYFDDRAQYRSGIGTYKVENIDPMLCTHIVYSYARINSLQLGQTEWNNQTSQGNGMFSPFVNARKRNPSLKVLLGVITGIENKYFNKPNGTLTPSTDYLRSLARNSLSFIRGNGFDGLEFTWSTHAVDQKTLFTRLFQAFKWAVDEDASKHGSRLILSVFMPAMKEQIDVYGKYIKAFEEAADFLSIRTYDFHGSWEPYTGFNAPLYGAYYESEDNTYLNWDWVAKYYFSWGISKRKINLVIPTYARSFTLVDETYHGPYAAVTGAGIAGHYTREPGLLAFYEVCSFIARGARVIRVSEQRVPYAFLGNQWISYEDVESVGDKACYANKLGFGGVGVMSVDLDDFLGTSCRKGRYPLLSKIYSTNSMCSSLSLPEPATGGEDGNLQRLDMMDVNLLLLLVLAFYMA